MPLAAAPKAAEAGCTGRGRLGMREAPAAVATAPVVAAWNAPTAGRHPLVQPGVFSSATCSRCCGVTIRPASVAEVASCCSCCLCRRFAACRLAMQRSLATSSQLRRLTWWTTAAAAAAAGKDVNTAGNWPTHYESRNAVGMMPAMMLHSKLMACGPSGGAGRLRASCTHSRCAVEKEAIFQVKLSTWHNVLLLHARMLCWIQTLQRLPVGWG